MIDHSKMKAAGKLVREAFEHITPFVLKHVSTGMLDSMAHKFIVENGGIPAPLGYTPSPSIPPFPKSICTSINHIAGHGIPDDSQTLNTGDIISIDISLSIDGHFADACRTFTVGKIHPDIYYLVRATKQIHLLLLEFAHDNSTNLWTGDIGKYTAELCKKFGVYPVPGVGGHGIGNALHQEPFVPPNTDLGEGVQVEVGSYITIEPVIAASATGLQICPDRWTLASPRGVYTAQEEHTIYVGENGIEILT